MAWAFGANLFYLIVEVVGGLLTGSLVLLADAAHMATDVLALGLALLAARMARRPATARRTFGYHRTEVLAAFVNGLTLWAAVAVIAVEAVERLSAAPQVLTTELIVVAGVGLLVNLGSALLLLRHRGENLNVRGAFLHMAADTLGSLAAVGAGLLMAATGWYLADPIAALVVGGLILWSSWSLVRESFDVLMQGTPGDIDLGAVRRALEDLEGVEEAHDVHVWTLTTHRLHATCHLTVGDGADHRSVLHGAVRCLQERFGVGHVTVQIEPGAGECVGCPGGGCEEPTARPAG
jgi:cobalt-zinc-cadmium efflux system protein